MDRRTLEALVCAWPGDAALADGNGALRLASNALRTRLGGPTALNSAWESTLAELVSLAAASATGRSEARPVPGTDLRLSALVSRLDPSDPSSLLLVAFDAQTVDPVLPEDVRHRSRDQSVARLVSGFVHDFNNLLTVMLGVVDNLHGLAESHPESRGDLAELGRAAGAATTLTRQLHAFVRRRHSQPTLCGIDTLLDASQKLLRRVLGEHIPLTLALDSGDAPVNLDPTDFDDVLVSLLGAARDALSLGGSVQISTARPSAVSGEHLVLVQIEARPDEHNASSDSGPSNQLDAAGGSSTRALVERYGGHLRVAGRPGVSALIELALPIVVSPVEHASTVSAAASRPLRILVVEDDAFLLRHVSATLSRIGHDVTTAHDGLAAVERLSQPGAAFDLLLTDVVMPGMAGPALSEAFRQRMPLGRVVYMSGYARQAAGDLGEEPLLNKPFSARQLIAVVQHAGAGTPSDVEVLPR
jgi:CheY-like chemotaxis protein